MPGQLASVQRVQGDAVLGALRSPDDGSRSHASRWRSSSRHGVRCAREGSLCSSRPRAIGNVIVDPLAVAGAIALTTKWLAFIACEAAGESANCVVPPCTFRARAALGTASAATTVSAAIVRMRVMDPSWMLVFPLSGKHAGGGSSCAGWRGLTRSDFRQTNRPCACHSEVHASGRRPLLAGRRGRRSPLRRLDLLRRHLDRDLLPAELSGAHAQARATCASSATAAAAQAAGFRACKRCRPDATPGSPEWDRARRPRRPRDAADRRRRGRPRGRRRAGRPARLHRAPRPPPARGGGRRGPARAGAGPARADRARPARDDRRCRSPRSRSRPASAACASSTPRSRRCSR